MRLPCLLTLHRWGDGDSHTQTSTQSFNMCVLLVSDQYSEHSRRCCVNTDPNMRCLSQYTLILPVQTVRKYSLKNMFQGLGIWVKFIKPNCLPHNHEGPSKRLGVVAHACIWEAGTAGFLGLTGHPSWTGEF